MQYAVRSGDSLWTIAATWYGDAEKWRTIAEDNRLVLPNRILVGQQLYLRDDWISGAARPHSPQVSVYNAAQHAPSVVPGRAFFFVLADEINPLRSKVVRKVMVSEVMSKAYSLKLGRSLPVVPNPELFGIHPTNPMSNLPPGRHALGMKPSPFSSGSSSLLGSNRIIGNRFWIDVDKAKNAGASFHETAEILADLERIAAKTKKPADLVRIEEIKRLVKADAEVLVKGHVPGSAIKGAGSMALTRGLQGVQIVGFAMTAIDMGHATQKSIEQRSVKPVAAETVRQVGGWATAWAGMKLGAAGGAALGIETGPGAIVTGAIGAMIGGTAGYFGFDWIADHIDAN
jgi:hypothetical protein